METRGATLKVKVDDLKKQFLSDDVELRKLASKELVKLAELSIIDFFIEHLKNKDRKIQMSAASALRSLANDRAIKPLLNAIGDCNNRDYTGSFVYALQTHNYQNLLIPVVNIALNDAFEAQNHALQMLAEGKFKTNKPEILKAKKLIRDFIKKEKKCANYEILIQELNGYINQIEKKL